MSSQIPLEKTIVLIVPAKGMDDDAGLRASLVTPGRGVRVLLCVREGVDQSLAASVAKSLVAIGIETQILLHAQAQGLGTGAFELRAPADMSGGDQIEFALALSDVVLKVDASEPPLERAARSLQKPVVRLGEPPPRLSRAAASPAETIPSGPAGFRTDNRYWDGSSRRLLKYSLSDTPCGWDKEGRTESTKRLKQCFQREWKVRSYFAPDEWQQIAPDRATLDATSPIVTQFDAMDRSAVYGSYIHRDLIWATHFTAAFAVFLRSRASFGNRGRYCGAASSSSLSFSC